MCRDLNATILFVTHDIDEAIFLSDRVVVMRGRPAGSPADIPISLPRPRGIDTLTSPEFIELKRQALAALRDADHARLNARGSLP